MPSRFLITLALIIIAEIYSFILVRSAVKPLPHNWRLGLVVLYILVTLLTWASIFFFRKIDWAHLPHMARNIYVAFTIGFFVAKILVVPVMLIDDLRRIFLWIILKIFPETGGATPSSGVGITRAIFIKRLALAIGGTTLGAFIYGITNRYKYRIKRVNLSFKNLPQAFRGLKIVQISDIHSGSFDSREAVLRGVEMVMNEKPDVVFFTGDLVNNKAEEVTPYLDVFAKLKAPLGVYSVLGNHDYGDYVQWSSLEEKKQNLDDLKQRHSDMGWRLLLNEHLTITKDNEQIAIIGVENWSNKAGFPKYGDLQKSTLGLTEKQVPFNILLSHDPSHWDAEVNTLYKDIDLTLSGHTHGMQFGVEIPGFKWSPVKYVYNKWAGLYQTGDQYLYVNRGYGFLGYPGRLGILPEITVIELT